MMQEPSKRRLEKNRSIIFIPLTLIVGIYGVNLLNMPEYAFPYSYPILLIAMLYIGVGLVAYFRKKRWF